MAGKNANEKYGDMLIKYESQPKILALIIQAEKLGEEIHANKLDSEDKKD